jgi:hypothetical protein
VKQEAGATEAARVLSLASWIQSGDDAATSAFVTKETDDDAPLGHCPTPGLLITPLGVLAQEPSPHDLFPAPDELGSGWKLLSAADIPPSDTSAIEQLSEAIYVGPEGNRATVLMSRVAEGPAATRKAWEFMGQSFENFRMAFDADYSSERDLEEQPFVDGCADMRRMDGADKVIPALLVGVSLCAADPDTLVLAYVSGEVDGLSGHAASDRVVELVLARAVVATPVAS